MVGQESTDKNNHNLLARKGTSTSRIEGVKTPTKSKKSSEAGTFLLSITIIPHGIDFDSSLIFTNSNNIPQAL